MHSKSHQVILAAGLTPAWQQIVCLQELKVGHVNRARTTHWCASGKIVNVGVALHQLGGPSTILAPLGGAQGEAIASEMSRLGATARWLRTKANTRVCTTIIDESATSITEVVENAAPLEPDEVAAFVAAFREEAAAASLVVLTGSLPRGVDSSLFRELLRHTTAPAILDIRGQDLLAALERKPLMVKPNREELAATLGTKLPSDEDLVAAMRQLNARGAAWVLVTQGTGPAWLTSATHTIQFQPAKVRVVNAIGCGDSLAAGVAWSVKEGRDMVDAVRFGLAAAAANAESLLPGRFEATRAATLHDAITVTRL